MGGFRLTRDTLEASLRDNGARNSWEDGSSPRSTVSPLSVCVSLSVL